jgi:hypothetical protein
MTDENRLKTDTDHPAPPAAKPTFESLLADAHNLPDEVPGDELGGSFKNGEELVPREFTTTTLNDPSGA